MFLSNLHVQEEDIIAYYSLANPQRQIQTYVYDVIRGTIPKMSLNQVFESKSSISDTVFTRLQQVMKDFGYEIVAALVANVTPNELVKFSMNEVNVSRRLKDATPYQAEAGTFSNLPTSCVVADDKILP
jgi:regulator of protease activity HflC (stomatin/prohibitin superfamily)